MEELLKDIPGYEGQYAATKDGQIWSYKHKKFLKQRKDKDGYLKLSLCEQGKHKTYQVHRLIAATYIPNPENKPCVNHKDENKQNNNIDNLEWITWKDNNNYGTRTERAAASLRKKVYCVELDRVFDSVKSAGQFIGCRPDCISMVLTGKRKTTHGYHWERVE